MLHAWGVIILLHAKLWFIRALRIKMNEDHCVDERAQNEKEA